MKQLQRKCLTVVGNLNKCLEVKEKQLVDYLGRRSIYPSSIWKALNFILFLGIFGLLLRAAKNILFASSIDKWRVGDWLINYQGGFVRRGLIGEILLWFSNTFHIHLPLLVIVFQIVLYLIFLIFTYRLVIISSFNALNIAIVYSPAFMLFTAKDSGACFRKEVLFLAFFAFLCYYLVTHKGKIPIFLYIMISVWASVIVLSHEMLLTLLPYVFCSFLLRDVTSKEKWKIIFFLLPAFFVMVLIFIFGQGSTQTVIDICHSLADNAPDQCQKYGAISFLSKDIIEALRFVRSRMSFESLIVYSICAFLGFFPLLLFYSSSRVKEYLKTKHINRWFIIGIIIAIISSLPIFLVAIDYGRFIYIHVASLSLLALMLMSKVSKSPDIIGVNELVGLVFSSFFILSWRLLHFNAKFSTAFLFVEYLQSSLHY